MKKIIYLIVVILLMASCCESDNRGYGYNSKPSITTQMPVQHKITWRERLDAQTMKLYDTYGEFCATISSYKGEYDGHTWYVFIGADGPAVIHDPNCKCLKESE